MVQLKKKAVLLIGALMLLLGMGMNLQYALDDYGLADNNAVIAVWAQQTKTGDDPAGTCISGSVSAFGVTATGKGCEVSTGTGYYSCCRVTSDGLCRCPSCKN